MARLQGQNRGPEEPPWTTGRCCIILGLRGVHDGSVPCPQCQRHIGTHHDACPFCQNTIPAGFESPCGAGVDQATRPVGDVHVRGSPSVAACGGTSGDGTIGDGGTGDTSNSGSSDGGGGGTADGGGASDAGLLKDSGPKDDGGVVALYGLPPPPDAGALTAAVTTPTCSRSMACRRSTVASTTVGSSSRTRVASVRSTACRRRRIDRAGGGEAISRTLAYSMASRSNRFEAFNSESSPVLPSKLEM